MPGDVSVNIGCNYEDFLKGLATVKKEADLAVLEQRKKDQAEREERRAAARKERQEQRAAEREKMDAARKEKKESEAAWRNTVRQMEAKKKAEEAARKQQESSKAQKIGVAQSLISGGIGGAISSVGAMFGPWGMLAAEAINAITAGIGKLIDQAKEIRNLSYATGLSSRELSRLGNYAESTGTSLSTVANAFYEFNKRMATAQIRGSEFNMAAAKLGLNMEGLKNRTLTANDAIRALSAAHKAGTDDATLSYYGNILLGSSFEQLLPAIKRGASEMDAFADATLEYDDVSTAAMARVSDQWNVFWGNIKAIFYNIAGAMVNIFESVLDFGAGVSARMMAFFSPEAAARRLNVSMLGATDERKKIVAESVAKTMSKEGGKEFMDAFNKILGEGGKKVEPFGLATARGASTMQQMGGGDIVSAIAFTPLERIAMATEQTAKNTEPKNQGVQTETKPINIIPLGY